jgi:hypothetical protein
MNPEAQAFDKQKFESKAMSEEITELKAYNKELLMQIARFGSATSTSTSSGDNPLSVSHFLKSVFDPPPPFFFVFSIFNLCFLIGKILS